MITPVKAIENFQYMREQFPILDFCDCGNFATIIKPGPETGKPFHLCTGCSRLWTEHRLGITEAA